MKNIQTEKPDLVVEKLQIWIHGRQFPDATDYDDANWLNVSARYDSGKSCIDASGSFIHLSEIQLFFDDSEKALQGLVQTIELPTVEPILRLTMELDMLGHIKGTLNITPDSMSEEHTYTLDMDQSYLPGWISQCKAILAEYPITGN
jgi:hypothetical protein